jgi:hypothetical protein
MTPFPPGERGVEDTEDARMTEQARTSPRPEADPPEEDGGPSTSGPPTHENEVSASDQAIITQKRALESGEENVV